MRTWEPSYITSEKNWNRLGGQLLLFVWWFKFCCELFFQFYEIIPIVCHLGINVCLQNWCILLTWWSLVFLCVSRWKVAWNRLIMLRDLRGIDPFRTGKKIVAPITAEATNNNIAHFTTIIFICQTQLY